MIDVSRSYTLRASQRQILEYSRGWMGISAVPGSGKTWTLSLLAADLISRGILQGGQEVLVVTLVNSAVEHFSKKVRSFLQTEKYLPFGFRIRTLHGLAHDIVRERPDLVGLPANFIIIDERETGFILTDAARTWLRLNPYGLDEWIDVDDENRKNWIKREKLPELVQDIALQFIRTAKDQLLTPNDIDERLDVFPMPLPLVRMGTAIYQDYQSALKYRGGVDFDDLICLALGALQADHHFLDRLRFRWPFILEDEAQDSSHLQEEILRILSGENGNWVRVGDPNQAIYETFTTATPKYLRQFLANDQVIAQELPTSGRSTPSIIALANELVRWTQTDHPIDAVRDALVAPPFIVPTDQNDPQANPPDQPERIYLETKKLTALEEIQVVTGSVKRFLQDKHDQTVAILVPRNQRGAEITSALKKEGIEAIELLQSTIHTRMAVQAIIDVFDYLSDPNSPVKLSILFRTWMRGKHDAPLEKNIIERTTALIRRQKRVEDYIWPGPDFDWLRDIRQRSDNLESIDHLVDFQSLVRRWQAASILPVDQLLLTVSQDLFREPSDLALSYKLSTVIRRSSIDHPEWRLPEITQELVLIAKNGRKFLGFSQDDTGFNPDDHPGKVVVTTIHRAKGLEWDRVYLMSVNSYDFPGELGQEHFIAEKWYIRERLNLSAETLAQFEAVLNQDEWEFYEPGSATTQSRLDYIRERLRLLYVGITRARKELIITWNTGRLGDLQPAIALVALQNFWMHDKTPWE
jgi:DNA helicase II / ATP-dependent DNA helicase PcrA